MNSIQLHKNRTLKLTNAMFYTIENAQFGDVSTIITQMENYAKSKGCNPYGPIIQHTYPVVSDSGEITVYTHIIRQTDSFIHHIEQPYSMKSILRVKDCIYARYRGSEKTIKLAVDKIRVYAFENNIELKDESWVVYADQVDDDVIVDAFVERVSTL